MTNLLQQAIDCNEGDRHGEDIGRYGA
jgi:hypothetical protein